MQAIRDSIVNPAELLFQTNRERDQRNVSRDRESGQDDDDVAAGPELFPVQAVISYLGEELLVPLLSPEQADEENSGSVDGKQCAYAVKLRREDLQNHQGKRELRQGGPHVSAFEGPLCSADLDQLLVRQHNGAGSVQSEMVAR